MADGLMRSVIFTPEQDAFLDRVAARFRTNRSWAIRYAVDRLAADPAFFVEARPSDTRIESQSREEVEAPL